ncbi:hypothetical protein CJP74_00005 [Psittacicella melopsittaci]|uniref:Conjugal transfer mating pair stabilization protein TraN n=1 Tax=Psittacicella melopsittaci TaxID=2028576 RepID=A0A3A1YA49_9GAMM|nr:conjugal transfer protein TraN [Psittacicella melopsittaci]RIY34206.1 hypothetical protein CJP74_00005 [Psittacicella melopsittaci]
MRLSWLKQLFWGLSIGCLLLTGVQANPTAQAQKILQAGNNPNSPEYQSYLALRNDPKFMQLITQLNWQNLQDFNFAKLTSAQQQQLVKLVASMLQAPPTIVDPSQQATWDASKDYAEQASGIASRSLAQMPNLQITPELTSGLEPGQTAQVSKPCFKQTNSQVSCTQPRIIVGKCIVRPTWQGSNTGTGDIEQTPAFAKNNKSCGKNCFSTQITLTGKARFYEQSLVVLHALEKMRFTVRLVEGDVPVIYQGQQLKQNEIDVSEHYQARSKTLSLKLTKRITRNRNQDVTLEVRGYFTRDLKPTHIDWNLESCPWQRLTQEFKRGQLNETTHLASLNIVPAWLMLTGMARQVTPQNLAQVPLVASTKLYTARCLVKPVALPTDKKSCVKINGKTYCRIANPYNPYLEANAFCEQIEITWQYPTQVKASCKDALAQALKDNPQGKCQLKQTTSIYQTNQVVAQEQDPYNLQYAQIEKNYANKGQRVRGIVGYTYEYQCSKITRQANCAQGVVSNTAYDNCPLEVNVEELQKNYRIWRTEVCAMGRNCPSFIVYANASKKPKAQAASATFKLEDYLSKPSSSSGTGKVVSLHKNCQISQQDNDLISYRCWQQQSFTTSVVKTQSKCAKYTCSPGDIGCDRLTQAHDVSKALASFSLLTGLQEETSCDPRTGVCRLFAGKAHSCRCSGKGLVDCCNLPTQASLNDYLSLGFKLTQLNEYASRSFGYENPLGSWSNLGDLVNQGFSKAYQFSKNNLTSLYENFVGNSAATSTTLATAPQQPLSQQQVKFMQRLLNGVYAWIKDNLGAEVAGRVFTTQGANVTINPKVTQAFNYAMFVYTSYTFVKNSMELAYACEEREVELANKRKLRSCTTVGTYCSQRIMGSCIQTTTTSCCYSSPLARILQEQIRAQLNLGFGSAQVPNCAPLTDAELEKVDWDKINLDEWIGIMLANPEFAALGAKLADQRTLLSRTTQQGIYDQREAGQRNSDRLSHLGTNLTLDAFVSRAIEFLINQRP